jgi:hypothetical protein
LDLKCLSKDPSVKGLLVPPTRCNWEGIKTFKRWEFEEPGFEFRLPESTIIALHQYFMSCLKLRVFKM